MTTKRETILTAITTALGSTAGVSGRVYRSRAQALRLEETPAVLVEPVQISHAYPNITTLDSVMQFRVTVITRGAIPDQLADASVASAYALLMADRQLGGLAMDMYLNSTSFTLLEGDGNVGASDMVFSVMYRTSASSMES